MFLNFYNFMFVGLISTCNSFEQCFCWDKILATWLPFIQCDYCYQTGKYLPLWKIKTLFSCLNVDLSMMVFISQWIPMNSLGRTHWFVCCLWIFTLVHSFCISFKMCIFFRLHYDLYTAYQLIWYQIKTKIFRSAIQVLISKSVGHWEDPHKVALL